VPYKNGLPVPLRDHPDHPLALWLDHGWACNKNQGRSEKGCNCGLDEALKNNPASPSDTPRPNRPISKETNNER